MRALLKLVLSLLLLPICATATAQRERQFKIINSADGLADNSAQIVVCTKTGRIITATIGNLNFYDGTGFTIAHLRQEHLYQLPAYRGDYRLYFDRRHHAWLKNAHVIACLDLMHEQYLQKPDSVFESLGCPTPVLDFFTDSLCNIWTLSEAGLYSVETGKTYNVLRDRNLQDIEVIGNRLLLFYDNGEETTLDLETGSMLQMTKPYDWEKAQNYAWSSVIKRCGDGIFQIRNGEEGSILLFFDTKTGQWTTIDETSFHLNNFALHNNLLYIGSSNGYGVYDIALKKLTWKNEIKLLNGEMVSSRCNGLEFDKQGGLWIATDKRGLLYAKPKSSPFKNYKSNEPEAKELIEQLEGLEQNITEFQGISANCMFTDSRGWSWIGTSSGLYMYKAPQTKPIVFNRQKGFYNNVIHAVVEDKRHNIWAATSNGISFILFDADTVKFVNSYNDNDNVPTESFYNCKAKLLPDGRIIMQAIDHVLEFNPDSVTDSNNVRPYNLFPKLTKLTVNGNTVEPNVDYKGTVIIDRAITRVSDISVNSDQNTLSLSFSALNYYRPLQTFYHVKVDGLPDSKWETYSFFNSDKVDDKGTLILPLVGLMPGDYAIHVQASMFPGQWKDEPLTWYVHVNQPWWRTTGILLLFGLIAFGLMITNFILYTRNAQMRTRRNHEEEDVVNKIRLFVERYDNYENKQLKPVAEEMSSMQTQLSSEFIDIMTTLIPFVKTSPSDLSMRKMGEVAKVEVVKLYEVVMANIYKSPRDLVKRERLIKGASLLTDTDMSIEQIARECSFYTPNYFIGNFFHEYKVTPQEYRDEHNRQL
ncbi:MAG: helix-turn-helix domain-containing protein [Prevotella sp.]|nr:helix-turn-helix domain-containing protein [Prevotella sp.]